MVGRKRCPPFKPVNMCGGHATVAVPPWPCNRPRGQAAPVAVPCLLRVPVAMPVAVAAAVPGPMPEAVPWLWPCGRARLTIPPVAVVTPTLPSRPHCRPLENPLSAAS